MDTNDTNTKLDMKQLYALLEQYLPPDVLTRVKDTLQDFQREDEWADLWRFRDRTTGMYNTQGILRILEDWKGQCLKTGENIAILCIDIDRLETITLIYGNSERDTAIRTVGQILAENIAGNASCGHLDSSEFVIVMHISADETAPADELLNSINERIDNYNRISDKDYSLHVTHSLFLISPSPELQVQDSLSKALSQKRMQNENADNFIGGGTQRQNIDPEEHRLVNEVLDQNLFRYAFQPIIDAKTGDIYAYEALMRTAEGIQLSPLTILKYATLDGRLYDVERATFFNVLRHLSETEDLGTRKVFINSISNCQLVPKDYKKLRSTYGSLFSNMIVEVTEQTEMDDERLKVFLKRSKDDGFGLAVDDYGTGYSNTASLLRYLPNCVKIDRLLITRIQEDPKKQHFVNNIITFAHDNGFLALAEGVETAAELRAVIQMGIDLIQGFYTAKPDFTLLSALPEKIKHEIINDNISIHENTQRKVYIVNNEREIPLMQLALEQYTGIVVAQPELVLNGNPDYPTGMSIKIKDGCTCKLTIRNVCMESVDDMPCIDIGDGADLTLVLDGNNFLNKTGIRVPDGSSCLIKGTGNLTVKTKGIFCYGIGNDFNSGVGSITYRASGKLEVTTDGNHCICIGGGIYRQGNGLRLLHGAIQLNVAGVEAIGIGCREGSIPIEILECGLNIDFRVASGCAIGCWYGNQKIHMSHLGLDIQGSGNHLCGVGSVEETGGEICIEDAMVQVQMTGQKVRLIGNAGGGLDIKVAKTHVSLSSEGSNVLGIGSFDKSATLELQETSMEIRLLAAENVPVGTLDENRKLVGGGNIKLAINNETEYELF